MVEDQADSAAAVVAQSRAGPITPVTETEDEHHENDKQKHVISFAG